MNLAEQWELYLAQPEIKDYLDDYRNCGITPWVPRWMVLRFLQEAGIGGQSPLRYTLQEQTKPPKEPR